MFVFIFCLFFVYDYLFVIIFRCKVVEFWVDGVDCFDYLFQNVLVKLMDKWQVGLGCFVNLLNVVGCDDLIFVEMIENQWIFVFEYKVFVFL